MKQSKINLKKYFKDYDWKVMIKLITFIGLLFLILIDQLVKFWITKKFPENDEHSFLPGFINIQYVKNYGSAFGLNQNKTILLVTFAFLVIFVLLTWLIFSKSTNNIVGVTFIMAGTIGNLIDRFKYNGGVIDFLKWDLFEPKTIFNIADIFIIIGIIIIIVFLVIETIKAIVNDKKEKKVQEYGKQNKKV